MSGIKWSRARHRPLLHKADDVPLDWLAVCASREMRRWRQSLTAKDRRVLDSAITGKVQVRRRPAQA